MKLVVDAPGKVNLCLFLGPRRADGRHELVTLIESVSVFDELTVSVRSRRPDEVHSPGPDEVHSPGVPEPNLVALALRSLRARGWDGPPLRVEISKRVPVAAGMGGGSADAAAVLRVAHQLKPVFAKTLNEVAAQLGADVPSQVSPGVAVATGAGERVQSCPPLAPHASVIVPQPFQLSTAEVYAEADRLGSGHDSAGLQAKREELLQALGAGGPLPGELLVNELEPAALSLRPEVNDALNATRAAGADYALVSGSGPTVFGLIWGEDAAARAEPVTAALSKRFPGTRVVLPVQAEAGRPREVS